LLSYLKQAFNFSLASCILSLLALIFEITLVPEKFSNLILPIFISIYSLAMTSFYRAVSVIFSILASEASD
jgi:hypothetical protein